MVWQDVIGPKYSHGNILLDRNIDVVLTNDGFKPITACHVAQSRAFELLASDGHDLPIVSINKGLPPNLTPLNPF